MGSTARFGHPEPERPVLPRCGAVDGNAHVEQTRSYDRSAVQAIPRGAAAAAECAGPHVRSAQLSSRSLA